MSIYCPKCQSGHIQLLQIGQTTGARIGSISGAIRGITHAIRGPSKNVLLLRLLGRGGSPHINLVCNAIVGAFAGSSLGTAVGEVLDENIIGNGLCHACGHQFCIPRAPQQPRLDWEE